MLNPLIPKPGETITVLMNLLLCRGNWDGKISLPDLIIPFQISEQVVVTAAENLYTALKEGALWLAEDYWMARMILLQCRSSGKLVRMQTHPEESNMLQHIHYNGSPKYRR